MTDDAIEALERLRRILQAGQGSSAMLADVLPEYTRGAQFVYQLTFDMIDKEIEYLKRDSAAKMGPELAEQQRQERAWVWGQG